MFSACTSVSQQPPDTPTFYFDSTEELLAYFTPDVNTQEIAAMTKNKRNHLKEEPISEEYTELINKIAEEQAIYVPMQNGAQISFRNWGEGYSNIALKPVGTYNKAWIWYFFLAEKGNNMIRIMYLDDEHIEFAKNNSCSALLKKIYPDAVNIDNYLFTFNHKKVYETEIVLADRTVSALVSEMIDSERIFVSFAYDEIYVLIQALPDVITDEWFKELSFCKYAAE